MTITPEMRPDPQEIPEELLNTGNEWFARLRRAEHIEDLWLEFERWVEFDPLREHVWCALEFTFNALVDLGLLKRHSE